MNKQCYMTDLYSYIKKISEISDEEGGETQWSLNEGNDKGESVKLCLLIFLCAVSIDYVPTHPQNPTLYRHHLYSCHHHLCILLPPTPTPPNMIATIADASVYYRRHHLRILFPPLLTPVYIIAATSDVSVYDHHHHFHILFPPLMMPPYIASLYDRHQH